MRKRVFGRQLSRNRGSRTALFRSLVRALVMSGEIITTKAKAKAVRGEIDKLVTLAKKGDVAARRNVLGKLGNDRETTDKLFGLKAVLNGRSSGFTRIVAQPSRKGDLAKIVKLQWVDSVAEKK